MSHPSKDEICSMSRKQLQTLAKKYGIKANSASAVLIEELCSAINTLVNATSLSDESPESNDSDVNEKVSQPKPSNPSKSISFFDIISVKVGDTVEVHLDRNWVAATIKRINKKSLRVSLNAPLSGEQTVQFSEIRPPSPSPKVSPSIDVNSHFSEHPQSIQQSGEDETKTKTNADIGTISTTITTLANAATVPANYSEHSAANDNREPAVETAFATVEPTAQSVGTESVVMFCADADPVVESASLNVEPTAESETVDTGSVVMFCADADPVVESASLNVEPTAESETVDTGSTGADCADADPVVESASLNVEPTVESETVDTGSTGTDCADADPVVESASLNVEPTVESETVDTGSTGTDCADADPVVESASLNVEPTVESETVDTGSAGTDCADADPVVEQSLANPETESSNPGEAVFNSNGVKHVEELHKLDQLAQAISAVIPLPVKRANQNGHSALSFTGGLQGAPTPFRVTAPTPAPTPAAAASMNTGKEQSAKHPTPSVRLLPSSTHSKQSHQLRQPSADSREAPDSCQKIKPRSNKALQIRMEAMQRKLRLTCQDQVRLSKLYNFFLLRF